MAEQSGALRFGVNIDHAATASHGHEQGLDPTIREMRRRMDEARSG